MSKFLIFILLITSLTLFAPPPLDLANVPADCNVKIMSFLSFEDAKPMSLVSKYWRCCFNIACFSLKFLPEEKIPISGVYDQLNDGQTLLVDDESCGIFTFLRKKLWLFWSKGILFNPDLVATDFKLCRAGKPLIRFKLEHLIDLPKFLSPNEKYVATISLYKTDTIPSDSQSLIYSCENGDFVGLLPGYFAAFSPDDQTVVTWSEVGGGLLPYRLNFYNLKGFGPFQENHKDFAGILTKEINIGAVAPASFGYSKNGRLAILFENGSISVVNTASEDIQTIPEPQNQTFRVDGQDCPLITQLRIGPRLDDEIPTISRYYRNSAICFTQDESKILIARPIRFNVIPEKYRKFKKNPSEPDDQTRFTLIYTIDAITRERYGDRHLIPGLVTSAHFVEIGCSADSCSSGEMLEMLKSDGFLQNAYSGNLEFSAVEAVKEPVSFFQRNKIKIALPALIVGVTTGLFFARNRIKTALKKGKRRRKKLALAKKLADEKKKMTSEEKGGKV